MTTDVFDNTFERDVMARSAQVPVVVDLWAEWCGPCRTLGPILEKVVAEKGGQVELVKVNVDTSPGVAAAFQVQSIPAVYAIRDGKVVDSFIGALPEARVREFVDRIAPSETDADRLAAKGDEASYRLALELDPSHEKSVLGLAEALAGRGDTEEALSLLARIPDSNETRRVAALARVGTEAEDAGVAPRLDALLERVKEDDTARQEFVDLLELLGPDDPRTAQYRKALASRLYDVGFERRGDHWLWVGGPVPPGSDAITIGNVISVRREAARSPGLLRHEEEHVRQWRELGVLGFLRIYLGSYVRWRWLGFGHRAAYRLIPLEVEAEEASRPNT